MQKYKLKPNIKTNMVKSMKVILQYSIVQIVKKNN